MSLEEELSRLGLAFSPEVCHKLELYLSELARWNRTVNLTALRGSELVRRLVVEPCWIGQELQMSGRLLDLGSGNGSPGIPLYLSRGMERAHLVEARTRRAAFLRHISFLLNGVGITVHKIRLEEMTEAEEVDWIVLQGVAPSVQVVGALRRLFESTTRVVWITSEHASASRAKGTVCVPGSNTVACVLQLDQF